MFTISCKSISKEPIKGAEQYCKELAIFAAKNDYSKADELTRKYLDNYEDNDLYVFLTELKRQLSISEKHHLIARGDSSRESYNALKPRISARLKCINQLN